MDPDLEAIMESAPDILHGLSSRFSVDEVAKAMKSCGNGRSVTDIYIHSVYFDRITISTYVRYILIQIQYKFPS